MRAAPAATRCPLGPWPHTHPAIIYHPQPRESARLSHRGFFSLWGEAVKYISLSHWEDSHGVLQVPTKTAPGGGGDQDLLCLGTSTVVAPTAR